MHYFFWFDPFLRPRAEIEKYFRLIFGSNENFKICFRDYLTFMMILIPVRKKCEYNNLIRILKYFWSVFLYFLARYMCSRSAGSSAAVHSCGWVTFHRRKSSLVQGKHWCDKKIAIFTQKKDIFTFQIWQLCGPLYFLV